MMVNRFAVESVGNSLRRQVNTENIDLLLPLNYFTIPVISTHYNTIDIHKKDKPNAREEP